MQQLFWLIVQGLRTIETPVNIKITVIEAELTRDTLGRVVLDCFKGMSQGTIQTNIGLTIEKDGEFYELTFTNDLLQKTPGEFASLTLKALKEIGYSTDISTYFGK